MSMMMLLILKFLDSPKTQKSKYLENGTLYFSSNKNIHFILKAIIWQKYLFKTFEILAVELGNSRHSEKTWQKSCENTRLTQ